MNPRGCDILGYSRDELKGQPVLKFQPEDEYPHIQEKLALLAVEKRITIESAFIRKDGVRIPVEITGKLLSDNKIIGMLRDISERKKAEQDLVDSERKFRSLVEQSPDGIFMADEEGIVIEWNHGMENISALKRSDVIGCPLSDVQYRLMPEELQSEINFHFLQQQINEILETGKGNGLDAAYETIFQLADGLFRSVEVMPYTYKTSLGYRIGAIVRDITERKQAERRLKYLAMHDVLTDLPNRQLFHDRLIKALERAQQDALSLVAVMLLDLDNFKEVNDKYGHAYGDQLLKIVARRLQTCLRKTDTAARMGGDEFTIIIDGAADIEGCRHVAQKVLETLSEAMEIEGQSIQVTASIGISFLKFSNNDPTTLLRQADIAMYQAKRQRNCYKFYDSPLSDEPWYEPRQSI
jgi:diguanylate cyclase (GGDEF)-like protein/PAS domain S-box-containing protein